MGEGVELRRRREQTRHGGVRGSTVQKRRGAEERRRGEERLEGGGGESTTKGKRHDTDAQRTHSAPFRCQTRSYSSTSFSSLLFFFSSLSSSSSSPFLSIPVPRSLFRSCSCSCLPFCCVALQTTLLHFLSVTPHFFFCAFGL